MKKIWCKPEYQNEQWNTLDTLVVVTCVAILGTVIFVVAKIIPRVVDVIW